ncbi:MAG TPA: TonB-dependent receptor [Phenylobacterium sp.]|uniref:TonB-dependent receptor n=1 Tax=Phenylobacterium sp. TaxID=1871053 RepID=UPI002D64A2D8|nr:TonB-dependent receptor [Phenylobacterium sp.]HZZ66927.1 TonB-dependent receptor [Phenylobacterium sp.]
MRTLVLASASALCLSLAAANAAHAATDAADAPNTVSTVTVTAPSSIANLADVPNTISTVTADQLDRTTNLVTPEDALRYVPDVLVRQRHIGDTQSPITSRTSGVGASARTLLFVDGILLSALIGNNNTSASPKWGLINPDAIERVDVLNGPFSAAYAGNSIGSVIAFVTRMPSKFEATAEVQGASQSFSKYGDDKDYGTDRFAGSVGDRMGPFAFRLSYNHLDDHAQPLTYTTATVSSGTNAPGTPVAGAFTDANRTRQPIFVLGSDGIEHQVQDNVSGRFTWDLTPTVTAAYTFGLFVNNDDATVASYLRGAAGNPVYAGSVNIAGRTYGLATTAFSNGVYHLDETELAQGLSISSHTDGVFDYDVTLSGFDYLKSHQRTPTTTLPGAFSGGAGSDAQLDGTSWITFDADGKWRPAASQTVMFGLHEDNYLLDSPKYALGDWLSDSTGALQTLSKGQTHTWAIWAQDVWAISPEVKLTLGGRYEWWRAEKGLNFSATPSLDTPQPEESDEAFSPKAVLAWAPFDGWIFKGSVGVANRFPTVSELYQAITTGPTLSTPNPNLKPEQALSSELSAEKDWTGGSLRVSLFDEHVHNALISQTGTLNGLPVSFVQNVDRTRSTGVEVVGDQKDLGIKGFELSGWVTYLDAETVKDPVLPTADGKRLPQLARWRAGAVATYSPTAKLDLTLAARYSDRMFATIDNSDHYANTYQGFGAFFVVDAHARYKLNDHLAIGVGVDNLNDRKYFLFHPFPQRTVLVDLKYTY